MKNKKIINLLVGLIVILVLITSLVSLFYNDGGSGYTFKSLHGKIVNIYGNGLYKNDSVSAAVQGKAQDLISLCIGIPLLIISIVWANRGKLKGQLFLAGTLAYFLYTYVLYTFFAMFNFLFLVYTTLITATLYAFILTMMGFNYGIISKCFSEKLPVKSIGGYLIFSSASFGLMWLGIVFPSIISGKAPEVLDHYTTLTVQGMDLGFLIPTIIIAGILLIRKRTFGYILAPIMIIKLITMMLALCAMVIAQSNAGEKVGIQVIIMVGLFTVLNLLCLYSIMKNIKEEEYILLK